MLQHNEEHPQHKPHPTSQHRQRNRWSPIHEKRHPIKNKRRERGIKNRSFPTATGKTKTNKTDCCVTTPTNDNNTCETLCELMNNHFFVQPYENTNMLSYQEIQKTQPPERPSLCNSIQTTRQTYCHCQEQIQQQRSEKTCLEFNCHKPVRAKAAAINRWRHVCARHKLNHNRYKVHKHWRRMNKK